MKIEILTAEIDAMPTRSAWSRAVRAYAREIVESLESEEITADTDLMNGARSWAEYSEGGCALIYDADIAERVCSPSELKKTRNGERQPNRVEAWIDVQSRALRQAGSKIQSILRKGEG
jgi:hypothetical protein